MSATKKPRIALRPMLPNDAPLLAALFVASINELTADDYSPAQQAAWATAADDEPSFVARLKGLLTIVATLDGELVGFAALKAPDHVDMLYVRPDVAGRGIATTLCEALEKIGQSRGAKALTVDASDTAQPFFARRGYESVRRETVALGDEWLGRTAMRKILAPADETRH